MPGNSFYKGSFWQKLREEVLIRDNWRCAAAGCFVRATHVDHIERRPPGLKWRCSQDNPANLRCLCAEHDNQVKEGKSGERNSGGLFTIKGADEKGWPLDANHLWNLKKD